MNTQAHENRRAFTLVELLVVVAIAVILTTATIATVVPAFQHRLASEGARILQASLAGARDAAIRSNAPRGIRIVPDTIFTGSGGTLAASRMIPIELAPDYSSGKVKPDTRPNIPFAGAPIPQFGTGQILSGRTELRVVEVISAGGILNEPTAWYWNIRQGEKIRLDDSGRYYTIVGPMVVGPAQGNPERYINYGPPGYVEDPANPYTAPIKNDPNLSSASHYPEFLVVTNGQDDNDNGYVDEGFDGLDNDGDGVIDPGYTLGQNNYPFFNNGGEYEEESFVGTHLRSGVSNIQYTILRRPVVSPGASEVALPEGVVIDLSGWNNPFALNAANTNVSLPRFSERSRLPVDPNSFYVEIMIGPNGQVVNSGAVSGASQSMPFYHFWIAERSDVLEPLAGSAGTGNFFPLANLDLPYLYVYPMPAGTPNYDVIDPKLPPPKFPPKVFLKGERRLVTLATRTGLITTVDIQEFDGADPNKPYYLSQFGLRDAK